MSYVRPQISPELDALRSNSDLTEVAKALGYGLVTTDFSLLTQGGAATFESLEDTLTEIHLQESDMEVKNKIAVTNAAALIDQWDEVPTIGQSRGLSIADVSGGSKQSTRGIYRRFLRLKFVTTQWNVSEPLIKQANFMPAANKEDVAALTRLEYDKTWMLYKGDSSLGDDPSDGQPLGGDEYDGIDRIIDDVTVSGRYDGPLVFDCFTQGSGLDGLGFTNPADLEYGLDQLSRRMALPLNGVSPTPEMYVGMNVRQDIQNYRNFQPVQVLSPGVQNNVRGMLTSAFANVNTPGFQTSILVDKFMPDGTSGWFKTPQTRGEAVAPTTGASPLTVTTAPASDVSSLFATGWDGTYYYFVAPFGRLFSQNGYEGAAVASAATVVVVGNKVTLTITRGTGSLESGYLIYRSRRNGSSDPADARLIKRVPAAFGTAITTFVDFNRELPNSHTAYIIKMDDVQSIEFRQLYSPYRITLPRNIQAAHNIPGMVSASIALRSRKHRRLAKIVNIQSKSDGWSAR